jgi:5'-nucleotidase
VVLAGHTHRFINAYLPNRNAHPVLVTQANSYSAAFADVTLQVDKNTHFVMRKSARIVTTYADEYPGTVLDAATANIVKLATDNVAPIVNAHVGELSSRVTRTLNKAGESALGNLIADAFKFSMDADIGLTNASSMRADLNSGEVTWGHLYAVQPFGNQIVKMIFKGQDILDLLEQQWKTPYVNILQTSGLTYIYDDTKPVDYRIKSAFVNGRPIEVNKKYSVAVNIFLANGGSGFSVMKRGEVVAKGATDLDALITYVKSLPQPFSAIIEGRIKKM